MSLPEVFTLVSTLEETTRTRFGGTEGPDLTRYFLICGVLLAGTAGVAWAFRRLIASALRSKAAKRSLQIVDVLPLGNKHKLCVVRCYDRTFALGLGDKEVSLVAELDPIVESSPDPVTAGLATEVPVPPPEHADRLAFAEALERVRASLPKSMAPRETTAAGHVERPRAPQSVSEDVRARRISNGQGVLG